MTLDDELPGLIICDLDGTLIDFEHDHYFSESFRIFELMGYAGLEHNALRERFRHDDFFGFVPPETRESFEREFWTHYKGSEGPAARVFDGVLDALKYLRGQGVEVAIATARSNSREEVEQDIAHCGLLEYVSVISSRGRGNHEWRDKAEQIHSLCRHFAVSVNDSFMVGDTPLDIYSGRIAGSRKTIGVLSGGLHEHILQANNPTHIFDNVCSLAELLGYCRIGAGENTSPVV